MKRIAATLVLATLAAPTPAKAMSFEAAGFVVEAAKLGITAVATGVMSMFGGKTEEERKPMRATKPVKKEEKPTLGGVPSLIVPETEPAVVPPDSVK
ncbi:hypothetical protein [Geobacter pickeringii]|uniref:Uncharacterized protein n=1 Tax=Geobacter pickeringii TaxID=345632 RepID=A0A0B5BHS0_9BACT|nr:hypothetical protein [Geobacter pickeringii]AJE03591.1 hypothetical protein GPICK_09720 [Geobacter pickeringii]